MRIRNFAAMAMAFWGAAAGGSEASLLQQGGTENYIAFEAEWFDSKVGTTWAELIDGTTTVPGPIPPGASGNVAIWVPGTGSPSVARYNYLLSFATPGTYELYARGYVPADPNPFAEGQPNGNNDSFYGMNQFGADPAVLANYNTAGTGHPVASTNNYGWTSNNVFITVGASQVGVPITWAWAPREDGAILDRFIFSLNQSLTTSALDATPNTVPEPTATGILAFLISALTYLHRRRRISA